MVNQEENTLVGNQIIKGSDLKKVINHKSGNFTIKKMNPFEKQAVISETARRLGGALDSVPLVDYEYIRMLVTLEIAIIESPEWWEKNGGASRCLDDTLLTFLYEQCNEFEDFFRKKLQRGEFTTTSKG